MDCQNLCKPIIIYQFWLPAGFSVANDSIDFCELTAIKQIERSSFWFLQTYCNNTNRTIVIAWKPFVLYSFLYHSNCICILCCWRMHLRSTYAPGGAEATKIIDLCKFGCRSLRSPRTDRESQTPKTHHTQRGHYGLSSTGRPYILKSMYILAKHSKLFSCRQFEFICKCECIASIVSRMYIAFICSYITK